MLSTKAFYLLRAEECARDAAAASLANVRDLFLRSEAIWRSMAARASDPKRSRAPDQPATEEIGVE